MKPLKKSQLKSILLLEEKYLDELFDIMNEYKIKISKVSDFKDMFTNEFIYSLTRELLDSYYFNDLSEITDYFDNIEVLVFLSDCFDDRLFLGTNIFYIDLEEVLVK